MGIQKAQLSFENKKDERKTRLMMISGKTLEHIIKYLERIHYLAGGSITIIRFRRALMSWNIA